MKHGWRLFVLAAIAASGMVGCQIERSQPASQVAQTLTFGDACQAKLPDFKVWDGTAPPRAETGEVWVIVPSTDGVENTAALVNTEKAEIRYLTILAKGQRGSFLDKIEIAAQAIFPGHPNPPPPVIDPHLLVLYAQHAFEGVTLAEEDARACKQ
ncbi:MAG TPA: hypothetical protein VFT22_10800 [Kofleriaceae bacterium]|nr:hypothetical protein [Kofleriaceae bacterium]